MEYRLRPVDYDPFDEEPYSSAEIPGVKLAPVDYDPFEEEEPEGPPLSGVAPAISAAMMAPQRTSRELLTSGLRLIRGGDIKVPEQQGILDAMIRSSEAQTKREVEATPKAKIIPGIPITAKDIAELPSNLAYSMIAAGAGLAAGLPLAAVPEPTLTTKAAAWGAGMAASGAAAYRMAKDQFSGEIFNLLNERAVEERGAPLTQEEWDKIYEKYEPHATKYGLWEAIPEALGNAMSLGIIRTAPKALLSLPGVAGRFTKTAAETIAKVGPKSELGKKLLVGAGKFAAMQMEELGTETITQMGQGSIEAELGMRESAPGVWEAMGEVAPQTFLLTSLMGGAGAVGSKAWDKWIKPKKTPGVPGEEERDLSEQKPNVLPEEMATKLETDYRSGDLLPRDVAYIISQFPKNHPVHKRGQALLKEYVDLQAEKPIDLGKPLEGEALTEAEREEDRRTGRTADERLGAIMPPPTGKAARESAAVLARGPAYLPEDMDRLDRIADLNQERVQSELGVLVEQAMLEREHAPARLPWAGEELKARLAEEERLGREGTEYAPTIRSDEGQILPGEEGRLGVPAPEGEYVEGGQEPPLRRGPGEGGEDFQREAPEEPGGQEQPLNEEVLSEALIKASALGPDFVKMLTFAERGALTQAGFGGKGRPYDLDAILEAARARGVSSEPGSPDELPEHPAPGLSEGIDKAAHEAATSPKNEIPEPSEAQISAGNYAKGHITLHGLNLSIENPKGSVREGTDKTGKPWKTEMKAHYGYIRRSEAPDGDQVDVFIGPKPESTKVYVIDQVDPKTRTFDEQKVLIGYPTEKQARAGYLANYERGWKGIGAVTEYDIEDFKKALFSEEGLPVKIKPKTAPETKSAFKTREAAVKEAIDQIIEKVNASKEPVYVTPQIRVEYGKGKTALSPVYGALKSAGLESPQLNYWTVKKKEAGPEERRPIQEAAKRPPTKGEIEATRIFMEEEGLAPKTEKGLLPEPEEKKEAPKPEIKPTIEEEPKVEAKAPEGEEKAKVEEKRPEEWPETTRKEEKPHGEETKGKAEALLGKEKGKRDLEDLLPIIKSLQPPGQNRALVSISELRDKANWPYEEFDKALLQLAQEGKVALHEHDFAASLTEAERKKLLSVPNPKAHWGGRDYYVGVVPKGEGKEERKPKGKPLSDFTVKVTAIREATGEKLKVDSNAQEALDDVNSRIKICEAMLECLAS